MTKRSRSKAKKVEQKGNGATPTKSEAKKAKLEAEMKAGLQRAKALLEEPKAEAKVEVEEYKGEYWTDGKVVEMVAYLAFEVADEKTGEFKATDIVKFIGGELGPPEPWGTIVKVMRENPKVFTRENRYSRWQLVGWKPAAKAKAEEEPPKAESPAQKKAKKLVAKQAKVLAQDNGDGPPEPVEEPEEEEKVTA